MWGTPERCIKVKGLIRARIGIDVQFLCHIWKADLVLGRVIEYLQIPRVEETPYFWIGHAPGTETTLPQTNTLIIPIRQIVSRPKVLRVAISDIELILSSHILKRLTLAHYKGSRPSAIPY
jgi:hypothetical protein